jgi:hypothetical protein
MPGAINKTVKCLTELSPEDWVVQAGWPAAPTTLIDPDIATITGAADKVTHVDARPPGCWRWSFRQATTRWQSCPSCCCTSESKNRVSPIFAAFHNHHYSFSTLSQYQARDVQVMVVTARISGFDPAWDRGALGAGLRATAVNILG